jgi:hypothetical protein
MYKNNNKYSRYSNLAKSFRLLGAWNGRESGNEALLDL